jgi:fucose 4-O-acetylase-like acetyltransferase
MKLLTGASLALAILQNLCAAVLAISGIRLAIGLTAFALAGTIFYAPVRWFHQDAIRIPMLALATIGAVVDIAMLAWMRRLRAQLSAQWRKRERGSKERRSERLQLALAVLTLALVGLETGMHMVLHPAHPHAAVQSSETRRISVEFRH